MEEYEATQEMLLKRITEKDKAIAKTRYVLVNLIRANSGFNLFFP